MSVVGETVVRVRAEAVGVAQHIGAEGRKAGTAFSRGFKEGSRGTFSNVDREMSQTSRSATAATGSFTKLAKSVAGVGLAYLGVSKGIDLVKDSIHAASDEQKQLERVNALFGKGSEEVKRFADTAVNSLGLVHGTTLKTVADFGNMLVPLGIAPKHAAELSIQLEKLVGNLSAMRNEDPSTIITKIEAGLRGRGMGLKAYGIDINNARLQEEALRLGLVKSEVDSTKVEIARRKVAIATATLADVEKRHGANSTQYATAQNVLTAAQEKLDKVVVGTVPKLNQQQKSQAAVNLILQQGGRYMGEFGKHAGDLANQQRLLHAQIDLLKETLGRALLPLMQRVTGAITAWLGKGDNLQRVQRDINQTVRTASSVVGDLWRVFRNAVGVLTPVVRALGGVKQVIEGILALKLALWVNSNVLPALAKMGGGFRGVGGAAETSAGETETATTTITAALERLATVVTELTTTIDTRIASIGATAATAATETTAATTTMAADFATAATGIGGSAAAIVTAEETIGTGAATAAAEVTAAGTKIVGTFATLAARIPALAMIIGPGLADLFSKITGSGAATAGAGGTLQLGTTKKSALGPVAAAIGFGAGGLGTEDTGTDWPVVYNQKDRHFYVQIAGKWYQITQALAAKALGMTPAQLEAAVKQKSTAAAATAGVSPQAGGAVSFALGQKGKPYEFGGGGTAAGATPGIPTGTHTGGFGTPGYDCSGLIASAYASVGIKLPHNAAALAKEGISVSLVQIQPGDILVVNGGQHCVMYVGNGQVIAASSARGQVVLQPLSYWVPRIVPNGIRRIVQMPGDAKTAAANAVSSKAATKGGAKGGLASQAIAAAQAAGIDPATFLALVGAESSWKPGAVSKAGALGLTQLMPSSFPGMTRAQLLDPKTNLATGAKYLASLIARYGDITVALYAYNWGTANVDKWLAHKIPLPASVRDYAANIEKAAQEGVAGTGLVVDHTTKTKKARRQSLAALIGAPLEDLLASAERGVKLARPEGGSALEEALDAEIAADRRIIAKLKQLRDSGKIRKDVATAAINARKADIATAQAGIETLHKQEAAARQKQIAAGQKAETHQELVDTVLAALGLPTSKTARTAAADAVVAAYTAMTDAALRGIQRANVRAAEARKKIAALVKGDIATAQDVLGTLLGMDPNATFTAVDKWGRETVEKISDVITKLRKAIADLGAALKSGSATAIAAALKEWENLGTEIGQAIQSGFDDARSKAAAAAQAAQSALETAFGRVESRILTAFDRETQSHIQGMQAALADQIAQIQAEAAKLTPAEAALKRLQDAHDRLIRARTASGAEQGLGAAQARLRQLLGVGVGGMFGGAVVTQADIQAAQDAVVAAQQQIEDAAYDNQVAALQKQAEAERQALDAQTQAKIDALTKQEQAQEAAYQDLRDNQRQSLQDTLDDWMKGLEDGSKTWSDFILWLQGQVKSGIFGTQLPDPVEAMRDAGKKQGSAFTDGFVSELKTAWDAYQLFLQGKDPTSGGAGQGPTPTIGPHHPGGPQDVDGTAPLSGSASNGNSNAWTVMGRLLTGGQHAELTQQMIDLLSASLKEQKKQTDILDQPYEQTPAPSGPNRVAMAAVR